jgi:hypothetical protein
MGGAAGSGGVTGSGGSARQLHLHLLPADVHQAAVGEDGVVFDAQAIHAHAVDAAQILDDPAVRSLLDTAMVPRETFAGEHQVVVLATSDAEASGIGLDHAPRFGSLGDAKFHPLPLPVLDRRCQREYLVHPMADYPQP